MTNWYLACKYVVWNTGWCVLQPVGDQLNRCHPMSSDVNRFAYLYICVWCRLNRCKPMSTVLFTCIYMYSSFNKYNFTAFKSTVEFDSVLLFIIKSNWIASITVVLTSSGGVWGMVIAISRRLQQCQAKDGPPVLIRIETKAGHGGGNALSKVIDETADEWAFLGRTLGAQK